MIYVQYDCHNDDRNPNPHPPSFILYSLHVSDFRSFAHTCTSVLANLDLADLAVMGTTTMCWLLNGVIFVATVAQLC